jgi:hypothetical protein
MMRYVPRAFVVVSLLATSACTGKRQDPQSQQDHTALQGEWEIVSAESNGEPPPPGMLDGAKFAFSGDKLTLMGQRRDIRVGRDQEPATNRLHPQQGATARHL